MSPLALIAANIVIWLALLGTVVIAVLMGVDAIERYHTEKENEK